MQNNRLRKLSQILSIVFTFTGITVSFQNCGQGNWAVEQKKDGTLAKTSDSGIQPQEADALVIRVEEEDGESEVAEVAVDLVNQQIILLSQVTQVNSGVGLIPGQQISCSGLSEEQQANLVARVQAILDQSTICKDKKAGINANKTGPQFIACTQQYTAPYAKLLSKADSVELGEQLDGCSSVNDICGDNQKLLVNEIRHLMSELRDLGCVKGKAACESSPN